MEASQQDTTQSRDAIIATFVRNTFINTAAAKGTVQVSQVCFASGHALPCANTPPPSTQDMRVPVKISKKPYNKSMKRTTKVVQSKVHRDVMAWAGGEDTYEEALEQCKEDGLNVSIKSETTLKGVLAFTTIPQTTTSTLQPKRTDKKEPQYIKITLDDVVWWLTNGLDLTQAQKIDTGRKTLPYIKDLLIWYIDAVTGNRSTSEAVTHYESQAEANGLEAWSGRLVENIIDSAYNIRGQASADIGSRMVSIEATYVTQARIQILGDIVEQDSVSRVKRRRSGKETIVKGPAKKQRLLAWGSANSLTLGDSVDG